MSELQVFTYLPQRPAQPRAARLAPVGLTSLFLLVGKAGCLSQPDRAGGVKMGQQKPPRGSDAGGGGSTDVRGADVSARSDIPGQKGLKQSLSSSTRHLLAVA